MKFNDKNLERRYNWVKQLAMDKGFTEEELEYPYLDKLSHKTKSSRILRFISLAYYLGWLRGIKSIDEGKSPISYN